jgi:hypothetical protein
MLRPIYFEHILRSDRALNAIRRYIQANPHNWSPDLANK